jgi:hypothetical protein
MTRPHQPKFFSHKRSLRVISAADRQPLPLASSIRITPGLRRQSWLPALQHFSEVTHWDLLAGRFDLKRVNHSEAYSENGVKALMGDVINDVQNPEAPAIAAP